MQQLQTVPPTSPNTGAGEREYTSYLGMVIFLGGWAMMFAALFFAYAVVRTGAPSWPPPGSPPLPTGLATLNTVVLLASSFTMHQALRTIRNWRVVELPRWLWTTMVLGLVFLGLQLHMWLGLWRGGLRPSTGIFGSVFYGLTAIHAVHVVAGLFALLFIGVAAARGRYRKNRHTPVRMVGMFWHFVDVVWILMFFSVYVF